MSFLTPDKAVASKTNDLGAIECQNISFTSQESLPSKTQYPECWGPFDQIRMAFVNIP